MKNILYYSLLFFILFQAYSCTSDVGTVKVTYQEANAIYGDIDEIRQEGLLETSQSVVNPGKIYIGDSFLLIGEEGEGIHVVDNQDRANPIFTSFLNISGNREYFVNGDYLYAESYYDMLKIDISDLSDIKIVSRAKNAIQEEFKDENNNTLIGFNYSEKTVTLDENDDFMEEIIGDQRVYFDFAKNIIPNASVPSSFAGSSSSQYGTVNRITKYKDHIYTVSNNNMIIINDEQFASEHVRIENLMEGMETIFPKDDHLFIGSRTSMSIYNIESPTTPNEVAEFEHATSCDPVLPIDNVSYVTLRTADFSLCPGNINALLVIDVSDLSNPVQLQEIQMQSPFGMSVIGVNLYVGEGENGLKVFDVNDRKNPVLIQSIEDIEAYDIIADPQNSEIIFIAGPNGIDQYLIDGNQSLLLKSHISI